MEVKNCKWCQNIFQNKNANFCSVLCRNRSIASKNDYKSIAQKLKHKPIPCKECGKIFDYICEQKFCSRTCSARYNNRNRNKEVYKKQFETIKKNILNGIFKPFRIPKKIFKLFCFSCRKEFEVFSSSRKQKYCSKLCRKNILYPKIQKPTTCNQSLRNQSLRNQSLRNYRVKSGFKFNLADYPEEFDFELIKKHGWYFPKNKKNNLNGVSRDHIVSVKFGHDNNIDPAIISHPANCQLLIHSKNISKYSKCDISIDELKNKINLWNKKYSK